MILRKKEGRCHAISIHIRINTKFFLGVSVFEKWHTIVGWEEILRWKKALRFVAFMYSVGFKESRNCFKDVSKQLFCVKASDKTKMLSPIFFLLCNCSVHSTSWKPMLIWVPYRRSSPFKPELRWWYCCLKRFTLWITELSQSYRQMLYHTGHYCWGCILWVCKANCMLSFHHLYC